MSGFDQNLRPEDARGARRGARGGRRHGRLRVLSAVAAQCRLRGRRVRWASACGAGRRRSRCRSTPATTQLAAIIEALRPDLLQLHGKETPERVVVVRTRFGLPVMKALPIAERADLSPIRLYDKVADRLLFDARAPREATRPGGLGKSFDWRLLGEPQGRRAVHALGRPRCRQRRRGAAHHRGARRRCLLRGRARPRREGPRQDPRLHSRGPRGGRQSSPHRAGS